MLYLLYDKYVVEKSIEFNTPAYLCFIDLKKAFDRVRLEDIIGCLREREVPERLIRIIKDLNTNTTAKIKANNRDLFQ